MRFVSQATIRPHRCAVIPFIGSTHAKGFIDTGAEMGVGNFREHVYVSVVAVEEMARMLGWCSPADRKGMEISRNDALDQLERIRAERDELAEFKARIEALEGEGFKVSKRPVEA